MLLKFVLYIKAKIWDMSACSSRSELKYIIWMQYCFATAEVQNLSREVWIIIFIPHWKLTLLVEMWTWSLLASVQASSACLQSFMNSARPGIYSSQKYGIFCVLFVPRIPKAVVTFLRVLHQWSLILFYLLYLVFLSFASVSGMLYFKNTVITYK